MSKSLYVNDVYKVIAARLAGLSPPIHIRDHIDEEKGIRPKAGPSTLEGITFRPKSMDALVTALRRARNGVEPMFAEGSSFDKNHWALKLSFAATKGVGFREIFRFNLSDRPLLADPDSRNPYRARWSDRDSARFGPSLTMPDITSLHCAVSDAECNIHIDETGFVLETGDGEFAVGPNAIAHAAVELFLKTTVREAVKNNRMATWVIDHVTPIVPTTMNDLSVGLQFEPLRTKTYKLTFTGSCALHGESECSVTGTFTASHNLGGGSSPARPRKH